ncbi:hypothetical protein LJB96_02745 [Methanobrevibacter sp. OttesenSCG-928-K11]|nr:hypothetical protein [Methanobrevibacter sp. OttesenSCG-928-K11]
MFIIAFITLIYAIKSLKEAEKSRKEAKNPNVCVYFEQNPQDMHELILVIANIGETIAHEVIVNVTPELINIEGKNFEKIIDKKILMIAPKTEIKTYFTQTYYFFNKKFRKEKEFQKLSKRYYFNVSYRNDDGKNLKNGEYICDLSYLTDVGFNRKDSEEVKILKEIKDKMQ